jgi:N-acetyltransferase 10
VAIPVNQALALFVKLMRKIVKHLQDLRKAAVAATVPDEDAVKAVEFKGTAGGSETQGRNAWAAVGESVDAELKQAGDEVTRALRDAQRQMIDDLDLSK